MVSKFDVYVLSLKHVLDDWRLQQHLHDWHTLRLEKLQNQAILLPKSTLIELMSLH